MNIKHHFKCARNYLDQASKHVDEGNYMMAEKCVAAAYVQTRELLNQVQSLYMQSKVTDRPAAGSKK